MTFVAKFKIKEQNTIKAKFTLGFRPSKVSQLENDLHFQTEEDVASTVQSAVEEVTIETDAKITVVNETINDLSNVVEQNYLELDDKIAANHQEITDHIDDKSNPHEVTKAQVGLDNVDNTSDLNKPISTATQNALDTKVDKTSVANRVYGTDANGNQTTYSSETFGKVDDVRVDGTSVVTNKIANLGSMANEDADDYSTITEANSLYAEKSLETTVSNHISNKNNPHEVTKTQIGLGNVDNTSDLNKPVSTATQTALDTLSNTVSSNYTTLNTRITNETATLNTAITTEETNRQNADNNLQSQIDAITSASDVTDIVGTYAELQAYDTTGLPDKSIIKVLQDESRNDETTYYRWVITNNVGAWVLIGEEGPYYTKSEADGKFVDQSTTVNDKALSSNIVLTSSDVGALSSSTTINDLTTLAQQNALNSGITSAKVNLIDTSIQPGDNISQLTNDANYISGINQSDVINALGYTPYDSSNPNNYTSNIGTVTSVNDILPASTGNITITANDVNAQPIITSSNMLSSDLVDDTNKEHKFVSLSQLAKIDTALQPSDLNGYATEIYVSTGLATKQDVLTAGTDLEIISGGILVPLPMGYTQVEYITTDGTAYINTGITVADTDTLDFTYTDTSSATTVMFITGKNGSEGASIYFVSPSSSLVQWNGRPSSFALAKNVEYNIILKSGEFTFTNSLGTTTKTFTGGSVSTTGTCLIGAGWGGSTNTVDSRKFIGNISKWQIKDNNNTLRFNGVPCYNSNNLYGLYDTVSQTFFPSIGTSAFTGGNEVVAGTVINFTNASGYTKNVGTVTSVNNIQPDNNGNVTIPTGGVVDQTYDGTSTNAQSGIAIEGELTTHYVKSSAEDTTQGITSSIGYVSNYPVMHTTTGNYEFVITTGEGASLGAIDNTTNSTVAFGVAPNGVAMLQGAQQALLTLSSNNNLTVNGSEVILRTDIDSSLSTTSENPVQNRVIAQAIENISLAKNPNLNLIGGSLNIDSGNVSGFSTTDYMQFPFVFNFNGYTWTLEMGFTTGSDVTTQQNILDSYYGVAFAINNGKFLMALSSNGSSWDIGSSSGAYSVQANTAYSVKIAWDGSNYTSSYALDETNYTTDISIASTVIHHSTQEYVGGEPELFGSGSQHPFTGTINLNKWNLIVNGLEVWLGMDDVGLGSRANIDLSNLTEAGLAKFQAPLISGENIKTINNESILGNGNIDIEIPTNYVTTDTAQTITARKTFIGEKAIYFKQDATTNKLGFTLYNPSDTELGAFEWRPNTVNSGALLNVNVPYTSSNYVGFRYWGTAVNVIAPKVATAGNYFIPTHITDGTNTVTASNNGTLNISSLLPDVSNFVTNSSLATTLSDYVKTSLENATQGTTASIGYLNDFAPMMQLNYGNYRMVCGCAEGAILGIIDTTTDTQTSIAAIPTGIGIVQGQQQALLSLSNNNLLVNGSELLTSSAIANMQTTGNLVTSISSSSTDSQYPSAKCMYDIIGDIETLLRAV